MPSETCTWRFAFFAAFLSLCRFASCAQPNPQDTYLVFSRIVLMWSADSDFTFFSQLGPATSFPPLSNVGRNTGNRCESFRRCLPQSCFIFVTFSGDHYHSNQIATASTCRLEYLSDPPLLGCSFGGTQGTLHQHRRAHAPRIIHPSLPLPPTSRGGAWLMGRKLRNFLGRFNPQL